MAKYARYGELVQKPLHKYRLDAMKRVLGTVQKAMKPYLTLQQQDFLKHSNVTFQGNLLKMFVGENQELSLSWDGYVFHVNPPFHRAMEFLSLEDSKVIYDSLTMLVGLTSTNHETPFMSDDRFLNLDFDIQLEQLWVRSARGTRIHYKGR